MAIYCVYDTAIASPKRLAVKLYDTSENVMDDESLHHMFVSAAQAVERSSSDSRIAADPDVYNTIFSYCESWMRMQFLTGEYPTSIALEQEDLITDPAQPDLAFIPMGPDLWAVKKAGQYEGIAIRRNEVWPDREQYQIDAYLGV